MVCGLELRSVSVNIPCVLEKKHIFCCWVGCFIIVNWVKCLIVFKFSISLFFVYLLSEDCYDFQLFLQICLLFSVLLTFSSCTLKLLCDTLRIITSFWWIMKCPSLYLIIFLFVLKLSHNATATPSDLWVSVWVVYLFLSFLLQFISVFVFKVSFRQHVFSFSFFKKIKWLLLPFNCVYIIYLLLMSLLI